MLKLEIDFSIYDAYETRGNVTKLGERYTYR